MPMRFSKHTKYSQILNTLALKIDSSQEDNGEVDKQFNEIFTIIENNFNENKLNIVLEWFHAIVKKEVQIKKRMIDFPEVYDKPSNRTLIAKMQTLHSKIIEMVIDRVDQVVLGDEVDMRVIFELAQTFISSLTVNRMIDEVIYDNYIKILTQAMEIFSLE